MSQFEIRDLHKAFENEEVLKGVSLNVERGEIVSFIGPSGGGKHLATLCEPAGTLRYRPDPL